MREGYRQDPSWKEPGPRGVMGSRYLGGREAPAMPDPHDFNAHTIEEFRTNAGKVGGYFEGATLLLLHTKGAKSGLPRTNPLVYLPDGDRYVVIASKGGAPTHPDWYFNLLADPNVEIEVSTGTRIPVRASV